MYDKWTIFLLYYLFRLAKEVLGHCTSALFVMESMILVIKYLSENVLNFKCFMLSDLFEISFARSLKPIAVHC